MSKQLATLETSFDKERHVYKFKYLEGWRMMLSWVSVGCIWFVVRNSLRDFRWDIINLLFLSMWGLLISYSLYILVLKASVEINGNELTLIKAPFNVFGKNIKINEIKRIYNEQQILGLTYNVKAELINGKSRKLFFGLKQDAAFELAQHLDNSVKHFQKAQLTSTINKTIKA